jgi:hypothetical protein
MIMNSMGEDGILRVTVTGTVSQSDIEQFAEQFEKAASDQEKVRMLIELKDFEGWDFKGLWADLRFDVSHQDQMERIAILGDKRWEDWGTALSDPFFKAELKFFETDERAAAEAWLQA